MKLKLVFIILFVSIFQIIHSQNIWLPTQGPHGKSIAAFTVNSEGTWILSLIHKGIFFSYDQGINWEKIDKGLYQIYSYATSLTSGPNGIIYAIIDNELYRMESKNKEWDKTIYKYPRSSAIIKANPNGSLILYDYDSEFFYISYDKGEYLMPIMQSESWNLSSYSFNGNNNNYFIKKSDNSDYNLVRISDDGKNITNLKTFSSEQYITWHPKGKLLIYDRSSGLSRYDTLGKLEKTFTRNIYFSENTYVLPNGDILAVSYEGLYTSSNLGDAWNKLSANIENFISNRNELYFYDNTWIGINDYCNNASITSSIDKGLNWKIHNTSFSNLKHDEIIIDSKNNIFIKHCNSDQIIYSTNTGKEWSKLSTENKGNGHFAISALGTYFLSTDTIAYTKNDLNEIWKPFKIPNTGSILYVASDNKYNLIAYGANGNFISNDGGNTWMAINSGLQQRFSKLHAHPDGSLFGMIDDGFDFNLLYSGDAGINWKELKFNFRSLTSFEVLNNGSIIFSGYDSNNFEYGTFISNTKLEEYIKIADVLINNIVEDNNGMLFGFDKYRLCLYSNDLGNSWSTFVDGLPKTNLKLNAIQSGALAIDNDQYLYLGINYDVVYRTSKPVVDLVNINNIISKKVILVNSIVNYEINVELDKSHNICQYFIYDHMGRLIIKSNNIDQQYQSFLNIKLPELYSGFYYLNLIDSNNNNFIFKLIKSY